MISMLQRRRLNQTVVESSAKVVQSASGREGTQSQVN